jgi:ubiquinone/menaquinone biosynthesis C-methylase UbiE
MNAKEKWEKIWKEGKRNLSTDPLKYLHLLDSCSNKNTILDIGCGDLSSLIVALTSNKEKSLSYIVAIDVSENALKRAKKGVREYKLNADLICADCNYLPFKNNSFELVMLMSLLPLLGESYLSAFREGYRVAKENIGFNVTHIENALAVGIKDIRECKYGWISKLDSEIFHSSEEKISTLLKDFRMSGNIDVWRTSNHWYTQKDDILVLVKKSA